MVSFRDAMAQSLLDEAQKNDRVFILTPDLARSVRLEKVVEEIPEQYITTGISELNTIGIASGLSSVGYIPVVAGFSMFIAVRTYEQLRNIVAYPGLNVKIIATHCGICVGQDGATHQTLEDIGIMRMLPRFSVLSACDGVQTWAAVRAAIEHEGPVYLRLGRDKAFSIYEDGCEYHIGGSDVLADGSDIAIFTMGTTTKRVINAAGELKKEGFSAAVINAYSLKPFDAKRLLEYAKKCRCILTVEDHFESGGLGSIVAEILAQNEPVPLERVGVRDVFGESGTEDELYAKYGLDERSIAERAKRLIERTGHRRGR